MLPWKLRKCQILPVNQNRLSVYFSLAKFQLVSCNLSLDMIWQMTYTQKQPKLCSATLMMLMSLSFQENVMIVDSPGVGESEMMDEFVVNYMSIAFCFMYVINTHNAGGVQKDRVRIIVYVSIVLKLACVA